PHAAGDRDDDRGAGVEPRCRPLRGVAARSGGHVPPSGHGAAGAVRSPRGGAGRPGGVSSRLLLALVLLAAAACGHGPAPAAARPSVPLRAMPVLLPAAVPGVPSTTRALTSVELGKDAAISGLQGRLASWGYLDGRER